jgi:hypothetical protein
VEFIIIIIIGETAIFLSHSHPLKILPDCIRFSLLWISQQ